jgi:hypothetical protein
MEMEPSGRRPSLNLAGDAVLIAPVSKANSLVSGNFTGNFAILGLCEPSSTQDTIVLQRFLEQTGKIF